jgi:hypothetical protein
MQASVNGAVKPSLDLLYWRGSNSGREVGRDGTKALGQQTLQGERFAFQIEMR